MVTKDKQWWTFEVLGPSMIYNRFNREISCHCITAPPCHCVIVSPRHRVTASLCQSVICLAPCNQTSQSFALPPATKPVSHLTCPLPPNQSVIWFALYHRITASLHHCVSQSFAFPTATKPVSHLSCPLPPNQSVIWLALYHHVTASLHHCVTVSLSQSVICLSPCHQTSQSFDLPSTTVSPHHHIAASLHHCVSQSFALPPATKPVSHLTCPLPLRHCDTASPCQLVICLAPCHQTSQSFDLPSTTLSLRHRITMSPCQIFPTTWVWIWLVNANQHSSDWLIVPTTANQITGIEKPNYHKTLIFSPPPLWNGHMKPE